MSVASSSRELFIYYRVRVGADARAAAIVTEWQRQLMARVPGLQARLLRKDEPESVLPTWMETYAIDVRRGGADKGIDQTLEIEISRAVAELVDCIDGARHVEAFLVDG